MKEQNDWKSKVEWEVVAFFGFISIAVICFMLGVIFY